MIDKTGLELIGNRLGVSREAIEENCEIADFVRSCPEAFEHDPVLEYLLMKPAYVEAGLRWLSKGLP
jgi:hypothetical protein